MTKPINIRLFANLLSAASELDGIARRLPRAGARRVARKVAGVREILERVLDDEQACLYEALMNAR